LLLKTTGTEAEVCFSHKRADESERGGITHGVELPPPPYLRDYSTTCFNVDYMLLLWGTLYTFYITYPT